MRTIQARLSIATGVAVLSAIAILTAISARTAYVTALESASASALAQARLHAGAVSSRIEVALNSARSMAHMLAGAQRSQAVPPLSREQVVNMLDEVARQNAGILGAYTAWEPGAFDGKDAEYAGANGHDATGRFLPYLVRGVTGEVGREVLTDLENQDRGPTGIRKGEYYLCPKETLSECVLNPFPYDVQGRTVLMTSIVVPIVIDGRFAGIAGVDVSLDSLQQLVEKAELEGGVDRLAIVSANRRMVAARGRPDTKGKPAAEYDADLRHAALTGAHRVSRTGEDLLAVAPIVFGTTSQPWTLAALTPYRVAAAGALGLAAWEVSAGLLISALAIAAVVLVVAGSIKRVLLGVVTELRQEAGQVTAAARQIAGASRSLAEGSSQQAASLEETSASTVEINSMAAQNAERASSAQSLAEQSQGSIDETNRKLGDMIESMAAISASGAKISKILSAIDGIAFQTNILALNAAVEAARAGEAGLGFAVVADEVRNLAQRSAKAAAETSQLIEESIGKSNEGRQRLDSVAESIRSYTEQSTQIRALVLGVAEGSHEQARGIEQISRTVSEMEGITQQIAASAEEYAAASQEIETQTRAVEQSVERLEELVGARRK